MPSPSNATRSGAQASSQCSRERQFQLSQWTHNLDEACRALEGARIIHSGEGYAVIPLPARNEILDDISSVADALYEERIYDLDEACRVLQDAQIVFSGYDGHAVIPLRACNDIHKRITTVADALDEERRS